MMKLLCHADQHLFILAKKIFFSDFMREIMS